MNDDAPILFALQASGEFGAAVARKLGLAPAAHEERDFEDGEHKARSLVNVRGRDVFVIQSLYGDARGSVDDKLVRLLFFLGSLKDASAARVTAVVPYLAYARKDQKSQTRDPVTTRYVAGLFEAVGTDCVVTIDVHNRAAFQNAFRCRAENLEANGLFVAHFAARLAAGDEVAVVSPDAGGIKRAEAFRQRLAIALGRPVGSAFAEKHRAGGVVSGEALVGDVAGKVAIVIDDLVSAGHTIDRAARACLARGARSVHAAATHGVFAGEADAVLADCPLESLVVTDTIAAGRLRDPRSLARLVTIGASGLFAEAIARLHTGGSIAELLGH